MLLVPNPPINLRDNIDVTTAFVIGLIWEDDTSTGGTPVIDYKITYDQSTGVDITLVEGVTIQSYVTNEEIYQTQVAMTPGAFYTFKV